MHTHRLSRAEGRTNQDKKGKKPREAHPLSGNGSGRDKSGHKKKATKQMHSLTGNGKGEDRSAHRGKLTEQGALTLWRQERQVKTL